MKPTELLHPEQMFSIFAGYRLYKPLYEFRRLWKIVEVKNIMGSGLRIIGTDTYFFEIKIDKKNISFGKHVKL